MRRTEARLRVRPGETPSRSSWPSPALTAPHTGHRLRGDSSPPPGPTPQTCPGLGLRWTRDRQGASPPLGAAYSTEWPFQACGFSAPTLCIWTVWSNEEHPSLPAGETKVRAGPDGQRPRTLADASLGSPASTLRCGQAALQSRQHAPFRYPRQGPGCWQARGCYQLDSGPR